MVSSTKNIKCCVYLIHDALHKKFDLSKSSIEYQNFINNKPKFCDIGDDPSFFCSQKNNSAVTWGVCRHDVRRVLKQDDEVHFVAREKNDPYCWTYYYVGFGVIINTISHKDIWERPLYSQYQKYFNNLIRPDVNGFVHYEPLAPSDWHYDWKMRISSAKRNKELEDFPEPIIYNTSYPSFSVFPLGNNYIIFDIKTSNFNITNPKCIAKVYWNGKEPSISWTKDKYEMYFFANKKTKNFTNKGKRHSAFNLLPENADLIKMELI